MTLSKNLLRDEYEQLGGPKLSGNSSVFLNRLWTILLDNKKSTIYEVTLEAGFSDDNDEDMFIPLCERLLAMGLLSAYTELNYDEFREEIVEGSLKQGICTAEQYSEEERKKLNLEKNEAKFVSVTVFLSPNMAKKLVLANASVESVEINKEELADEPLISSELDSSEGRAPHKEIEEFEAGHEPEEHFEEEEFEAAINNPKDLAQKFHEKETSFGTMSEEENLKIADYPEEEESQGSEEVSTEEDELESEAPSSKAQSTEEQRSEIVSLGNTRAKYKKWAIASAGVIIAATVGYFSIKKYSQISVQTQKIEEHYESPSLGMRLISIKMLDDMEQDLANVRAKNASMGKEAEAAIEASVAKALKNAEEEAVKREKIAYEKGRNDSLGISETLKDKVLLMSTKMAVVKGECQALGRGNRIDKVFPPTLPVKVKGYLIDPDTKSIIGIEAENDQLLARADGPITMIRCYKGLADIWPSFETPFVGNDGLAKPINQKGEAEETNPLLK